MTPSVSVVIPSYNHGRYLGAALGSVLDQSLESIELIVVDDGSTDESRGILESVKDSRLVRVFQENRGAPEAINRGLSMCRAPLVAILNSDDCFTPQRLQVAADRFKAEPALGLWGSHVEIIDGDGVSLGVKEGYRSHLPRPLHHPERSFSSGADLRFNLINSNYWATTSNFVMRRSLVEEIGGMRDLRFAHDWDFAFRAQRARKAYLEPAPLLKYRLHGANTITQDREQMIFEVLWVLAQHLWHFDNHPDLDVQGGAVTLQRMEQLYESLDLYGCEKLFLTMQLFSQAGSGSTPSLPEAWLRREDPIRRWLVREIATLTAAKHPPPPPGRRQRLLNVLESVKDLL